MYLTFFSLFNSSTCEKKLSYKDIFNHEFNIGFLTLKKDHCAVCEEYKNTNTKAEELINKFEKYIKGKEIKFEWVTMCN